MDEGITKRVFQSCSFQQVIDMDSKKVFIKLWITVHNKTLESIKILKMNVDETSQVMLLSISLFFLERKGIFKIWHSMIHEI